MAEDKVILQSEKAKFTVTGDADEIVIGDEAIGEEVYDVPVYPDIYADGVATDVHDYPQEDEPSA